MPATPRMTMMNNPFLVWMNLGWKTAEMTSASAQVYNHRMSRMVNAGSFPSAADQREFSRMGQEKIEAGMESLQAMIDHAMSMNYSLWQQYVSQLMAVGTAMLSLATSRTITQSLARQQKLTRAVMTSSRTGARLSDSAAKLSSRGLRPVHSRASANARRLKL